MPSKTKEEKAAAKEARKKAIAQKKADAGKDEATLLREKGLRSVQEKIRDVITYSKSTPPARKQPAGGGLQPVPSAGEGAVVSLSFVLNVSTRSIVSSLIYAASRRASVRHRRRSSS